MFIERIRLGCILEGKVAIVKGDASGIGESIQNPTAKLMKRDRKIDEERLPKLRNSRIGILGI